MLVNILAYPGMTMLDAIGPCEVPSRLPQARVRFIALTAKAITSDTGFLTFIPTCDLDAAGPADVSAGIDMALALSAEMAGRSVARAIQAGIEYDPVPPFPYAGDDPACKQRAAEAMGPGK